MKLCKDCYHFDGMATCMRRKVIEPVFGRPETTFSGAYREREPREKVGFGEPNFCGPDGYFWKQKAK